RQGGKGLQQRPTEPNGAPGLEKRILDALRSAGASAVFDAASRTDIYLLTKRGGFGPITKIYATGGALLAAFANGSDEPRPPDLDKLRAAPLRILTELAPREAEAAALELLEHTGETRRPDPLIDAAAHALAESQSDAALAALVQALRESAPEDPSPVKRQAF